MPHKLSYDSELNYMSLRIWGTMDTGQIRELSPKVSIMARETNCLRILIDMSAALIRLSIFDFLSVPKILEKSGLSKRIIRAIVFPTDLKDARVAETALINRDLTNKVFTNVDEAREWLIS